jgi:hypothetical protein
VETVNGQTMAIVLPAAAPVASVILVPGGSTMATLGADGPDGLILTSTVTEFAPPIGMSVADVDVSRLAMPVLFVHNANDACRVSPPAGVAPLAARITAARAEPLWVQLLVS